MRSILAKVGAFVIGFTVVYVALGVSVAFVGGLVKGQMKGTLLFIAGLILLLLGLHLIHIIRIPLLERTAGGINSAKDPRSLLEAVLVGVAFAVGWSPCTGPIIGAMLVLAGAQGTTLSGGILLLVYCLGLGVPFLLTALAVGYFLKLFEKLHSKMRWIELISGILLAGLGGIFLSGKDYLLRGLMGISLEGWEMSMADKITAGVSPWALFLSFLAGFLSFVSPCVLPLLPSYMAFIASTTDIEVLTEN